MMDTESRIAAALRDDLDTIEPSPGSWEAIRKGRVARPRRDLRRPLGIVATTAAAAAIVIIVLVTATPPEGGHVTDLAPPDPEEQPGLVIDEIGDARPAHLDLQSASVQATGDRLQIGWTLVELQSPDSGPVDYRMVFTDRDEGGELLVLVVRLDEEPVVGIARCAPHPSGIPDCTDRQFSILDAQPQVGEDTVSVSIPLSSIEIPLDRLAWTAYVQEVR